MFLSGVNVDTIQGKEYAIKVYKTSIMVFKDRDKYVSGEYRYRHGYCRSNPRKMVKVRENIPKGTSDLLGC